VRFIRSGFCFTLSRRRQKPNELQSLKIRLTELLELLDRNDIAVPIVEEHSKKAFRTRGAGNAQDKKKERKKVGILKEENRLKSVCRASFILQENVLRNLR
jgi:hypothetical protein